MADIDPLDKMERPEAKKIDFLTLQHNPLEIPGKVGTWTK